MLLAKHLPGRGEPCSSAAAPAPARAKSKVLRGVDAPTTPTSAVDAARRAPRIETMPFLRRLLAQRLAGRAVDLAHESRDRNRKGVADDARQPLVILVLERRLAGFDQRAAAPAAEAPLAGMIGSSGLSDQGTPFSAKICSSASTKAGFSLSSRWSGEGKCALMSLLSRSVPQTNVACQNPAPSPQGSKVRIACRKDAWSEVAPRSLTATRPEDKASVDQIYAKLPTCRRIWRRRGKIAV